jgi:hypothetical protein
MQKVTTVHQQFNSDEYHTLAMYVNMIPDAMRKIVSLLTTYNSCKIAAATRPVPRMAVPVFETRFRDEGNLLITSDVRSTGGGGFGDELGIQ